MSCSHFLFRPVRSKLLIIAALFVLLVIATQSAQAQTESVVYTFTGGSDGADPIGAVVLDAKGNLYGTTAFGGANDDGTVFMLTPQGVETVLHSFANNGSDGTEPEGGLVRDKQGNLYGTTVGGGTNHGGTVFKVTPSGTETVLYSFCQQQDCPDGAQPFGGLVFDKLGNLYGTTRYGGDLSCITNPGQGCGIVFELTPPAGGIGPWTEKVLHTFTGQPDGAIPYAGVVLDAKGNLYGTTWSGGFANPSGTVFKLSPSGTETILHTFTQTPDGSSPYAGLVLYKGYLYGTTVAAGKYGSPGTVFKISPSGKKYTVLYSFTGGSDQGFPYGGPIVDKRGNLYGTTIGYFGQFGTVFELTPSGSFTTLYSFTGSPDGASPYAGLAFDRLGDLYGTTPIGGDSGCGGIGCGTVFKVVP